MVTVVLKFVLPQSKLKSSSWLPGHRAFLERRDVGKMNKVENLNYAFQQSQSGGGPHYMSASSLKFI